AVVLNGALRIKANKKAMDSTLEQIKNLVFEAGSIKSPLANLAVLLCILFWCICKFSKKKICILVVQ
uniref:hypothetical protein n=1 Tax=Campylobacter jejuni TaxID=197 RepID=UPI002AA0C8D3